MNCNFRDINKMSRVLIGWLPNVWSKVDIERSSSDIFHIKLISKFTEQQLI